jgi:hypothetical protein
MNRSHLHKLVLTAVVVASLGAISAPSVAHADASCSSLLSGKISNLVTNGGSYTYTVTIVKDSLAYVTFTKGYDLKWDGTWLHSTDKIQFSDRYNGSQNFNINEMEPSAIWIDQSGHLWIRNDLYNSWIVSGYDMSCVGGLISKYVPGLGVVTVRIGAWQAIVF